MEPGQDQPPSTLHFICGKAGSGKTTLARHLAKTLPAVFVCEDEWISSLGFTVATLDDYLSVSSRCRKLMESFIPQLLRNGVSVVLDFAGNTRRGRAWVRKVFETARVDHVLHLIESTDDACLQNIHRRNAEKTPGLYWGHVGDDLFHAVNAHFAPPAQDEGFDVVLFNGLKAGPIP